MAFDLSRFGLDRLSIDGLYGAYLGMNPREQTIAVVVAGFLLLMIIVLPVAVASSRIASLEEEVKTSDESMRKVVRDIEMYKKDKAELGDYAKVLSAGYDPTIKATLEALADRAGIKEKIDSQKDVAPAISETFEEVSVEVNLKQVPLDKLVDFLHAIGSDQEKYLLIKKLIVEPRFGYPNELNPRITVSTYKLKGIEVEAAKLKGDGARAKNSPAIKLEGEAPAAAVPTPTPAVGE